MVVGIINPSGVDPDRPPPTLVRLLKTVSPFRYAIEALCLGEYPGMEFFSSPTQKRGGWFRQLKNLPRMGAMAMVQNGDQVIEALGLDNQTYSGAMVKLSWLSLHFLSLSWLGLEFQAWRSVHRPSKTNTLATGKLSKAKTNKL